MYALSASGAGLAWKRFHLYDLHMKYQLALAAVFLLATLALPNQNVAARDRVMADSAALVRADSLPPQHSLPNDVPPQPPIAAPSQTASATVFRDLPSISGRYSFGGKTVLPYVGAGFGGGYASEFNRPLGGTPPVQTDVGLRSQFGQGISPNEFQMGVRIPF